MVDDTRRRFGGAIAAALVGAALMGKPRAARADDQRSSFLDIDGMAYDAAGTQMFAFPTGFVNSSMFIGNGGQYLTHTKDLEGYYNLGVGMRCLAAITTGSYNVAGGLESMSFLTTGSWNTAWGEATLCYNVAGNRNAAFGWKALLNCQGDDNAAFGYSALIGLAGGVQNTAGGSFALGGGQAMTGNYNTAYGYAAGADVTTGSGNLFVGLESGRGITTGNDNTIVGPVVGLPPDLSQSVVIADGAGVVHFISSAGTTLIDGNNYLQMIQELQQQVAALQQQIAALQQ